MKKLISPILFVSLLIVAIIGFLNLVQTTSAPHASEAHGNTQIDIQADTGWLLLPNDCATISWAVEGIQGLYIDEGGQIGQGSIDYCPAIDSASPKFDIVDNNGVHRYVTLDIHYLPDLVFYLAGFVGIGFTIFYTLYMLIVLTPDKPFPIFGSLSVVVLLAILGTFLRFSASSPQPINITSDAVSLQFWSEHDHIVFPDECVVVGWSVVGADQILFNGEDVTALGNPAQATHCSQHGNEAILTVVDANYQITKYTIPIPSVFPYLDNTTIFAILSIIGLIFSGVVFIPLLYQKLRDTIVQRKTSDLLAIGGFFVFILLLYFPFGFESIGHWEEWVITSYIGGKSGDLIASEMVSRYWVIIPHTLAYLISSESFIGYHLVNFGMFFGKLMLLYAILRHLKLPHFFAFLTTILFMVYPVNTALMSLRSFPMQFSAVTLLTAVYLILDYRKVPSRLKLLGVWWGLSFNIFSNESAYVIILVLPLLWWLSERKLSWKNFNLTAIWYLYPAYKVALLLLLANSNRAFYQSAIVSGTNESTQATPSIFTVFRRTMEETYWVTFVDGWQNALASLADNPHIPVALGLITITAGIGLWLSRQADETPPYRYIVAIISGLLLIPPSVGVLMWIPLYRGDLWRMYFYVPMASALVVMGLLFLLTYPIKLKIIRNVLIIALSIGLIFPATARLLSQHEQFVTSANHKATVLYNLIELAPQMQPDTHIILTMDLSREELEELGMFEFVRRDMFNSALYLLYGEHRPQFAYFCLEANVCSNFPYEETLFNTANLEELAQRTLVFKFYEDLSVELVENPADDFALDVDLENYTADDLFTSGDMPPLTMTMLSGHE